MRRSLCVIVILVLMTQKASAQDPFGLLFGDEERIETGAAEAPGQDDLLLVSLRLGRIRFGGNVPAFRTARGLCVVAADFVDAIEAPVDVQGQRLTGWYLEPGRRFVLDGEKDTFQLAGRDIDFENEEVRPTGAGVCLTLGLLRQLFAADFTFVEGDLAIDIAPHETWPIEAKLERLKARELLASPETTRPRYRGIDNPTRWLSWPTADLALAARAGGAGDPPLGGNAILVGDILHFTGRLQTVRDENDRQGIRFALRGDAGGASVALGDIAAPALPLLGRAEAGRGFAVASRNASLGADILGARDIRGALPEGWEAELHDDRGLVSFVTEPNVNGEYVFGSVPLRPGYNRFTVKLFGPFGETRERPVRMFLGRELNPENEVRWDLAAVQAGRSLTGDETVADPVLIGRGSVSYGLHRQATLRLEVSGEEDGEAVVASTVLASMGPALSNSKLAYGLDGGMAFESGLQARLGERHSLAARFLYGGSLENALLGFGAQHIDQAASLRVEGPVRALGYRLPLTAQIDREIRDGGLERRGIGLSTGTRLHGLTLRKTLQYEEQRVGPETPVGNLTGSLLVGGRFFGQRIRSGFGYQCSDGCALNNLSLTAQSRVGSDIELGVTAVHDTEIGGSGFGLNLSKPVGRATATFDLARDPQAVWRVGFGLRFSLYRMPGEGLRVGPYGMTQSGTLLPRVFEDIDDDGRYGDADRILPGTSFMVGGALRSAVTGTSGISTLDRIPAGAPTTLELKRSSLPDPFLMPLEAGREVSLRPGQVLPVDVPVRPTGEAELTVAFHREGLELPVAGLLVEARDREGRVVGQARTSYDGSVYLADLPLTHLTFTIEKQVIDELGATTEPVSASLSRSRPYVGGLELAITKASL